ncbi:hypothetical protein B0T11DRAFT_4449 [Plectosphaerella cucumerina]|uniref:Uncharacterized protein n=1 Tax=Plectosphaerella cucumerina TaxID=40658 RepID=A0A8K0X8V0_9PEZI|nr:hypothetical protein B0T11DRAFT_4449 [Plectosphaerella cucumerina]
MVVDSVGGGHQWGRLVVGARSEAAGAGQDSGLLLLPLPVKMSCQLSAFFGPGLLQVGPATDFLGRYCTCDPRATACRVAGYVEHRGRGSSGLKKQGRAMSWPAGQGDSGSDAEDSMTSGKTKGETGRRINGRRGAVGRRLKPGLSLEGGWETWAVPVPCGRARLRSPRPPSAERQELDMSRDYASMLGVGLLEGQIARCCGARYGTSRRGDGTKRVILAQSALLGRNGGAWTMLSRGAGDLGDTGRLAA